MQAVRQNAGAAWRSSPLRSTVTASNLPPAPTRWSASPSFVTTMTLRRPQLPPATLR
jgi:hypothetical protein